MPLPFHLFLLPCASLVPHSRIACSARGAQRPAPPAGWCPPTGLDHGGGGDGGL